MVDVNANDKIKLLVTLEPNEVWTQLKFYFTP